MVQLWILPNKRIIDDDKDSAATPNSCLRFSLSLIGWQNK